MYDKIYTAVEQSLAKRCKKQVNFSIEYPSDIAHGDFAINAAMVVAKELGISPRELAGELASELTSALGSAVASVEVAGVGFINITLSQGELLIQTESALSAGK